MHYSHVKLVSFSPSISSAALYSVLYYIRNILHKGKTTLIHLFLYFPLFYVQLLVDVIDIVLKGGGGSDTF